MTTERDPLASKDHDVARRARFHSFDPLEAIEFLRQFAKMELGLGNMNDAAMLMDIAKWIEERLGDTP